MSATFIFVLFVASAQLVLSSNPSPIIVRHVSSPRKMMKENNPVRGVGLVSWRCFLRKNDTMCSCTILNEEYVLARSACVERANTTGKFQIHAGASYEDNADQIVPATILNTTDPPPKGIVVLKLDTPLKFDDNVRGIKPFNSSIGEYKYGYVSGFRYEEGVYQLEFYGARIEENKCTENRLCAYGFHWPQLSDNGDGSKATDFLDYYNEETYQFDLVGVLDRHYEPTDATYYKVKDMIPWMIKNVPGVATNSNHPHTDR